MKIGFLIVISNLRDLFRIPPFFSVGFFQQNWEAEKLANQRRLASGPIALVLLINQSKPTESVTWWRNLNWGFNINQSKMPQKSEVATICFIKDISTTALTRFFSFLTFKWPKKTKSRKNSWEFVCKSWRVFVLIWQNSPFQQLNFLPKLALFCKQTHEFFQLSNVKRIRETLFTNRGEFWFCYCFDLPKSRLFTKTRPIL